MSILEQLVTERTQEIEILTHRLAVTDAESPKYVLIERMLDSSKASLRRLNEKIK